MKIRKQIYKCPKCSKTFDHKNDFRRHVNRKFQCKSNTKDPIQEPVFPKTVEFKCPTCNKTYSNNSNLTRHIKDFCKRKSIDRPLKTRLGDDDDNDVSQSTTVCSYCNKSFSRKDSLMRHQNNGCNELKIIIQYLIYRPP
jgi:uncharacterized Zn-finger protein